MTNKSNDDQLVLLKRAFAYEKAKDSVDVDKAWKEFEAKLADTDSKQGDEALDISDEDSSRLCGIADAFGHFVCGLSYCEPCRKERDGFGDR